VSLSSYVADVLRKHLGTEESSEHSTTQVSTFSTAVKVSVLTKGSIESPNGQALVIDLTVDGPGSLHEESVEIFDDKTGEIRLRIRPESNERN
jgi:hypothetical protein